MAPSLSGCDSLQDVANGLFFTQLRVTDVDIQFKKNELKTSGNDGSFSIIENLLYFSYFPFLFKANCQIGQRQQ